MVTTYTKHAVHRMQQRGIPLAVVDWLLRYGACVYDHHGTRTVFLTKRARRRLWRGEDAREVRHYEKHLDAFAVQECAGERVVTVGHRYRRIRR